MNNTNGEYQTAVEIFNNLKNIFYIKEQIGRIKIDIGGITANYNNNDAIGELLQNWIGHWLVNENIYFRTRENTQEFPDFLLSQDNSRDFLELKTYNYSASPAFDIANFEAYCNSLIDKPYRIYSDYLILAYEMSNSRLRIKELWLKKVWQITSDSSKNPLKIQDKRGVAYNIRPCNWFSDRSKYNPFENKEDFIRALYGTMLQYDQCRNYRHEWRQKVYNHFSMS